jgi:hypothetical protein
MSLDFIIQSTILDWYLAAAQAQIIGVCVCVCVCVCVFMSLFHPRLSLEYFTKLHIKYSIIFS